MWERKNSSDFELYLTTSMFSACKKKKKMPFLEIDSGIALSVF